MTKKQLLVNKKVTRYTRPHSRAIVLVIHLLLMHDPWQPTLAVTIRKPMTKDSSKMAEQLSLVVQEALQKLQDIVNQDASKQTDLMSVVKIFLLGAINSAVDWVERSQPDSSPMLYADLEAAMKWAGLREITNVATNNGKAQYSVSNIDENDMAAALNYMEQQLVITLLKSLHELPVKLRGKEMMIRCLEVLLANLLHQKFGNMAHQLLDALCGHVHMTLIELENRSIH